ncbi:hypothetical protein AB1Y20_016054 [Prymnesium parvum]|uniref:Glycosyltransferase subfamily 4-like N-terminal domain-containing protein n=1 Tax=Prymnesium parvum TaxID=97485 RepID=A0AB34K371_PRYPA
MRVLQLVPALRVGGVERGVLEVDDALVAARGASFVASSGGPLASSLRGEHLHWRLLARRDPLSVLLLNPLVLALWLRRHRIDVVHARSRCLVVSALLARLVVPRVRLVATWHGYYTSGSLVRRSFNRLLLLATRVILPSHFIWTHVSEEYPHADRTHWRMVYRGVRPAAAAPSPPADAEWVVLLPARLSRSKGHRHLIAALEQLPRWTVDGDGERVRIVGRLVGAAPPPSAAFRLPRWAAAAVGARTPYACEVEGWVCAARGKGVALSVQPYTTSMQAGRLSTPREEGRCIAVASPASQREYSLAKVVAMPSTRPEAFGRVLVEALSAQRLVVAFHHGAVGEICAAVWESAAAAVKAGTDDLSIKWARVTAVHVGVLLMGAVFLVAPNDVVGLRCAIEAAIEMPQEERLWRTKLAADATQTCFALKTFTERTLSVYREAVA